MVALGERRFNKKKEGTLFLKMKKINPENFGLNYITI
jgi:hypothetical protein